MKFFIIDPGHGGMLSGKSLTDLIHGKQYAHADGSIAYEGVINRQIASLVIEQATAKGLLCINLCPTEYDITLPVRVEIANRYSNSLGIRNVVGISLHSNASEDHKARGFEVWTSPGQNKSDDYASLLFNNFHNAFPDIIMRKDYTDNDPDKESLFYILRYTYSPWILPEFLFFDNAEDWTLLREELILQRYVRVIVNTMMTINNY